MNDQQRLADLERRMTRLERIAVGTINSTRLDGKASRELSISPDVEELRRGVGEKE